MKKGLYRQIPQPIGQVGQYCGLMEAKIKIFDYLYWKPFVFIATLKSVHDSRSDDDTADT